MTDVTGPRLQPGTAREEGVSGERMDISCIRRLPEAPLEGSAVSPKATELA